jgi:hypothetical protein
MKPEAKAEARPEGDSEARTGDASGNDEVSWMWPANGKLIGTFSEGGNKGIDIAGKAGDSRRWLPAAARSCTAARACAVTASW